MFSRQQCHFITLTQMTWSRSPQQIVFIAERLRYFLPIVYISPHASVAGHLALSKLSQASSALGSMMLLRNFLCTISSSCNKHRGVVEPCRSPGFIHPPFFAMEIYMRNIAFNVDQHHLKADIAYILHGSNYSHSSNLPLNFEIYIFPQKRKGPYRTGALTLPSEDIGNQFLRDYGGTKPRSTPADVLDRIRRLPYADPTALRAQEEQAAELQIRSVSVTKIQFGWECRDGVFSVECERECSSAQLLFDDDRREFRVKIFSLSETRLIAIRVAQISSTSACIDGPSNTAVIFLSLNNPPNFESESSLANVTSIIAELFNVKTSPPPRQRWSAFDEGHEHVAQFTSTAIRLVCGSGPTDLETFRWFGRVAHMKVGDYCYPVEYRGLFSATVREQYDAWVKQLEWCVAFQVEALTRNWLVDLKEALSLRTQIERMVRDKGPEYTANLLRNFSSRAKVLYWYGDGQQASTDCIPQLFSLTEREFTSQSLPPIRERSAETFDCLHVVVTPVTITVDGPFPERLNRVMRTYKNNQDSFLRVSFADENRLQFRFDREVDGRDFINRRVKALLLHGLTIAGRHFQFLAYSQSALKEHAVWFVKPFDVADTRGGRRTIDAHTIIVDLGSFRDLAFDQKLIFCPARYGARISQSFTATDASISIEAEEIFHLEDIEDATGTYCFTDGVGTISTQLAKEIWKELSGKRRRGRRDRSYPRAFQIRFMGSKGMLSVDHTLTGRVVCLRPSMIKFDAPHSRIIEIARAFDKPGKYYLNRPLIMLLEGLGVPYEVFQTLQANAVREAQDSVESLERAARLLETYGLGASFRLTSAMLGLHKLGVGPLHDDSFWEQMMDFAVNHVLRELKHHARIPVPDSWTLAIGRPPPDSPFAQESLRNTVVFSIKGERPLPSYLGGGDLDGDVYNVTTIPALRPTRTYDGANYEPAEKKLVNHESTMDDVAEFVAEYISNTRYNCHYMAYHSRSKASQRCGGLPEDRPARSTAENTKAEIQDQARLECARNAQQRDGRFLQERARHWSFVQRNRPPRSENCGKSGEGQRRNLEDGREFIEDVLHEFYSDGPRQDDEVLLAVQHRVSEFISTDDYDDDTITGIWELYQSYVSRLRAICADHTLSHSRSAMLTEEEAVIGTIVAKCSQPRKRKDLMSRMREQTANLVKGVRTQIEGDEEQTSEYALRRAWIAFRLGSFEREYFGARSFTWIALAGVFDAIKEIEEEERTITRGGRR
ncbi:putative RNA-dependent RNA polymerase 1 [Grifola frondosa]|uniref:RNA-dependent RNA polymerase n=1 Tax=Grifola frondosa TaxID=5627 RepID=A0A1C7MS83_GRIFR|nr:putative RNA-dependent RNA polymerase 1 [Grifola frondosa]